MHLSGLGQDLGYSAQCFRLAMANIIEMLLQMP